MSLPLPPWYRRAWLNVRSLTDIPGARRYRRTYGRDARRCQHEWEVEYLPDPMAGGAVVRSGALVCTCGSTMPDGRRATP